MIWEASAMAIPAGKDVAIVIPVLKTRTEHAADGSLRQVGAVLRVHRTRARSTILNLNSYFSAN
jgi:hypothetical protein